MFSYKTITVFLFTVSKVVVVHLHYTVHIYHIAAQIKNQEALCSYWECLLLAVPHADIITTKSGSYMVQHTKIFPFQQVNYILYIIYIYKI